MTDLDFCAMMIAPHTPTPFSPPDLFNAAKSTLGVFERTFRGPVYPMPRGGISPKIYAYNGWELVEAYPTDASASVPQSIEDLLIYVNRAVAPASTSVSTDVLEAAAPGAWQFYFYCGIDAPTVGLIAKRHASAAYTDSFVRTVYVREAELPDHYSAQADDFGDDDDSIRAETIRALAAVGSFMGWTDEMLARAGSFRRSSIHNWERGTRPQAAKVAILFAIDALITGLRRRLGDQEARLWLNAGEPPRQSRLLAGDYRSVSADAEGILFPVPSQATDEGYWVDAPSGASDASFPVR